MAQQVAKDPYNFEFLGLSGEVAERDLENALTSKITETLRELGPGFAFVGRQVHFEVDGDDFYVDLLFFHIEQSRYVVVELKTGKFQPEYAGKLNFYVALVDDVLRRGHHNETIGILICGTKNDRSVRYSLGRSSSPMAVAAYTYDNLPPAEQQALPDEGHIVAALEWAEPDAKAEAAAEMPETLRQHTVGRSGQNSVCRKPPGGAAAGGTAGSPSGSTNSCTVHAATLTSSSPQLGSIRVVYGWKFPQAVSVAATASDFLRGRSRPVHDGT